MRPALVSLGLVALCLAVFFQTLGHDFLRYDDAIYVFENPNLRGALDLAAITRAFSEPYEANWIPLTWISLHLDRVLFGFEPSGYHAVNLLQHAIAAVLLFLALLRMSAAMAASAFVAAVFAIHPLHVESVAWIAERKDTLSALFFTATLLAYAHYIERPGAGRYAGVVLCSAAGLLAKPMLVTLPAVLFLLDGWPLQRLGSAAQIRRAVVEKLPLLAISLAVSAAALFAQQRYGTMEYGDELAAPARLANAAVSLVAYLRDAFWPTHLAVFYPYPLSGIPWLTTTMSGIALLAITALATRLRRGRPYLLVGWLWFLVMLVPVLGLVQVGMQSRADRYTYLPLIGIAIAVAWLVNDLARGTRARRGAALGGAVVVAALSITAHAQTRHWRDTETLFLHALQVTENNGLAYQWVGSERLRRGANDEAEEAFREAARLLPKWATPHRGLADVLAERGEWRNAILGYERALRMAPRDARGHMRLARALAAIGETSEALGRARHALRLTDDIRRAEAQLVLGFVHGERGELGQALAAYDAALLQRPRLSAAHAAKGVVLVRAERFEDATHALERALTLGDDSAAIHLYLGHAASGAGRMPDAEQHYLAALERATDRGDADLAREARAALER